MVHSGDSSSGSSCGLDDSAPESLHFCTMSTKYCFSVARKLSNFSTVSMSTCSALVGIESQAMCADLQRLP